MKKEKLVVFDGNAIVHRAYHAIPPMTTKEGELTNAIYGYSSMLLKVLKELKPEYVAVAFDTPAPTFRHREYREYKATRKKAPDDLYEQFNRIKQVTEALNIPIFEQEGYEADDIIGTLSCIAPENIETTIVTGDLDELQLVNKKTKVYTMRRGFSDTILYDEAEVLKKYGFTPDKFVDYKALRGDPSDNIPGVAGVGEKTATDLIKKYGSIEEIYKNIDDLKGAVKDKLEKGKEDAVLSKKLSKIVCDMNMKLDIEKCATHDFDRQKIFSLFQELGFKSLLNKLPKEEVQQGLFSEEKKDKQHIKDASYNIVDSNEALDRLVKKLSKEKVIAVDTETTSISPMEAKLVGISLAGKEKEAFYIPIGHTEGIQLSRDLVLGKIKSILENKNIKKVGHNLKYDYIILSNEGIKLKGIHSDTMIVAYLLNQNIRSPKLDDIAFSELGLEMVHIEEIIGKGKNEINFSDVKIEKAFKYSCEDADIAFRLYNHFQKELKNKKLDSLYRKIENPLISVLAETEMAGIMIDSKVLKSISVKSEERIGNLEKDIYKLSGKTFNINSPSQLQTVLFDELCLQDKIEDKKELKKVKSGGYSTGAGELDKLSGAHPIIKKIISYRELSKLKSTYIDALPKLVNEKTGRIHTSFNQAITATGRLSSSDPNLQNIPVRTKEGKEIRKAFVAEKGKKLLCVDYSQIELRIIAHIADDKVMIETFKKNGDIHTATAAKIYGISEKKVTPLMRRNAKAVNFGIIYGVSAHGLRQSTGMNYNEASDFIEKYFEIHLGIKKYMKKIVEKAKKEGYIETFFGRRRYLPEINSNNFAVRAQSERMAFNMPIQGTAADIIKLAMIEISNNLSKISGNSKMLLQVHDELVFEVPDKDLNKVSRFVADKMDNIIKLKVPVTAVVSYGNNWAECK